MQSAIGNLVCAAAATTTVIEAEGPLYRYGSNGPAQSQGPKPKPGFINPAKRTANSAGTINNAPGIGTFGMCIENLTALTHGGRFFVRANTNWGSERHPRLREAP